MMHAPAAGLAIAELAVRGRFETIDLTRLGYARIPANKPYAEEGILLAGTRSSSRRTIPESCASSMQMLAPLGIEAVPQSTSPYRKPRAARHLRRERARQGAPRGERSRLPALATIRACA
jgi:hypothetical protein